MIHPDPSCKNKYVHNKIRYLHLIIDQIKLYKTLINKRNLHNLFRIWKEIGIQLKKKALHNTTFRIISILLLSFSLD